MYDMKVKSPFHFFVIGSLVVAALSWHPGIYAQNPVKVKVEQPGSLEETVGAATQSPITALAIEGALDGKDIAYLRALAGGTFDLLQQPEQPGTLTFLNLKKATFVHGEEKYNFLPDAYPEPDRIGKKMFAYCPTLRTIVLPGTVTIIDQYAFEGCQDLVEVRNTDNIETVDWGAFQRCKSLSNISFGESLSLIRGFAFAECSSLSGFIVPQSVNDIGSNAFEKSGLCFIILPKAANDLGNAIFKECSLLKYARIEGEISSLPSATFSGCSALEQVALPGGCTTISSDVFADCMALRSIELPKSYNYIQGYAFWNCPRLTHIILRSDEAVTAAGAFQEKFLAQLHVYAPRTTLEAYKAMAPWSETHLNALEDSPDVEKVVLNDDFDAYEYALKEWQGAENWKTDHGAYIRRVGDNQVLKLGDNEGDGSVQTKVLNLSANAGKFRVRLAADGWNTAHSSFRVEAIDKEGRVVCDKLLTIPRPAMGADLRVYDFEMVGGTRDTYLRFSTTMEARIVVLDDIKVYHTIQPQPEYRVDTEEIDYGRVPQGADVPDRIIRFSGEHLQYEPSVRIVSSAPRVFTVDSEYADGVATITLWLDTEKVGNFSGYLQVDYGHVNTILIPLNAIIQDPGNPFSLDDSKPIAALNENFNAKALIPEGWVNIAVEGSRVWMMRSSGGINANRYPAIDALGDAEGNVHALLVLPALNFDNPELQASYLTFDLAAVKANGAQLRLVQVAKEGNITPILDLTTQQDCDWTPKGYPLAELKAKGPQFLAFEYIGEAGKATTVYRIDNVAISKEVGLQGITHTQPRIVTSEGVIQVSQVPLGMRVTLYTLEGVQLCSNVVTLDEISYDALPHGVYLVGIGERFYKVIVR